MLYHPYTPLPFVFSSAVASVNSRCGQSRIAVPCTSLLEVHADPALLAVTTTFTVARLGDFGGQSRIAVQCTSLLEAHADPVVPEVSTTAQSARLSDSGGQSRIAVLCETLPDIHADSVEQVVFRTGTVVRLSRNTNPTPSQDRFSRNAVEASTTTLAGSDANLTTSPQAARAV